MNKKVGVKFFIKLVAKFLLAAVLIFGLTQGAFTMVEDSLWDMEFNNDVAGMLNRCNRYLIKNEYGRLWDQLELYDLYDSQYDTYWRDVEERYNEIQYEQWERAMQADVDGAEEMVLYYENLLD